ncbi:uncharacterized protein LOC133198390 [Saccostrea echinata]|uniref:uncharacterized protein LOC133198390 n=1 Tax=Saccostrea echinata TaxID=191078 RepID=UPI002A81A081|nr:uncharacterized protein LOC133198390 [Saccostrea echinata]
MILVDYYSKYIDAIELRSETTTAIIEAMKTVFACHGIPGKLRSENGPQFSSANFKNFCTELGIEHERSSPHFQSSNGEAERTKAEQKLYYDRRRNVKELSPLDNGTTVRMETPGSKSLSQGIVVEKTDKPTFYLVKSKGRLGRRNRVHLHKSSENPQDEVDEQDMPMEDSGPNESTIENTATPQDSDKPANHKNALQTRSGRIVKPPEKLFCVLP